MPHSPPMPMPYNARMIRKNVKLGEKPQASSTTEKKTTLVINGMRRPYRSVISPKTSAPTGRITSVTNNDATISPFATWNSWASRSIRKTTTKKSNASSVQPRNEAATACACPERDKPGTPLSRSLLSNRASSNGFGVHAQRNIAIQHRGASGSQRQQRSALARPSQAKSADTKERRVNHGAAEHPCQQVAAKVARLLYVGCQQRDSFPAGGVRPHFAVEANENILGLCRRQQRHRNPHQGRDSRCGQRRFRKNDGRAAATPPPVMQRDGHHERGGHCGNFTPRVD